jgi:hypothetical protein
MSHGLKRKILWLALGLGFLFAGNGWAAPVLAGTHFPADIHEGQTMQLKLVFEWPAEEGEYEIQSPSDIELENLKFVNLSQTQKIATANSVPVIRLILTYEFLPTQKGQGSIGFFNVLYRQTDQGSWRKIPIAKLFVEIKPALSWKGVIVLLLILTGLVVPTGIWVISVRQAEREREKNFKVDPKQQIYEEAAKKFSYLVAGYTPAFLRNLLSEWAEELKRVVVTYYDLPIQHVTQTAIFTKLADKNIPEGELQEIKDYFNQLEHLKCTPGDITTDSLEKLRLSLLHYAHSKIVLPS